MKGEFHLIINFSFLHILHQSKFSFTTVSNRSTGNITCEVSFRVVIVVLEVGVVVRDEENVVGYSELAM